MFFRKKKVTLESIGEFKWVSDSWFGEYNYLNKVITLCVNGNKEGPDKISVDNLKALLVSLPLQVALAKEYIAAIDLKDFKKEYGEIIFEAILSNSELGLFDLEFGSTVWEDGYITVHFKGGKPYEISRGD